MLRPQHLNDCGLYDAGKGHRCDCNYSLEMSAYCDFLEQELKKVNMLYENLFLETHFMEHRE